ncbi:MAG: hypothetical protein KDD59_06410, partial [Bdellovibrionales bacterium]|nr:hypothetical protein [Bdellovibrionales bacterium]
QPMLSEVEKENLYESIPALFASNDMDALVEMLQCTGTDSTCREVVNIALQQIETLVDDGRFFNKTTEIIHRLNLNALSLATLIRLAGLSIAVAPKESGRIIDVTLARLHEKSELDESVSVLMIAREKLWQNTKLEHWRKMFFSIREPQWDWTKTKGKGPLPAYVVRDLVLQPAEGIADYKNGRYLNTPRLFMFCRSHRQYPCLMILSDRSHDLVRNTNGILWSQPALGYSRKDRPYYQSNGDTPAGVWRLDSVMPDTDNKIKYGDFRRVIMNFVEAGNDEAQTRLLLPPSNHTQTWWRQASIARDAGRGLFRIHGTGWWSFDSSAPYHPFVKTIGCVSQREKTYDDLTYNDQQLLLNELMKASGLAPTFRNESRIRGLFYVVEIDDRAAAVTIDDLRALGLE